LTLDITEHPVPPFSGIYIVFSCKSGKCIEHKSVSVGPAGGEPLETDDFTPFLSIQLDIAPNDQETLTKFKKATDHFTKLCASEKDLF
jgi:hypothetical protein